MIDDPFGGTMVSESSSANLCLNDDTS